MTGEYRWICPTCRMDSSMNYQLSRKDDVLVCTKDPQHRFRIGKDGFLRSV